jgi:hypothetical protein
LLFFKIFIFFQSYFAITKRLGISKAAQRDIRGKIATFDEKIYTYEELSVWGKIHKGYLGVEYRGDSGVGPIRRLVVRFVPLEDGNPPSPPRRQGQKIKGMTS